MFIKSRTLKLIRADLERGARLVIALKRAGIKSPQTFYRWTNRKPSLKRYVDECTRRGAHTEGMMVEQALAKKCIEGKASAADYELYLTNRLAQRWKSKNAINSSINITTKVNSDNRSVYFGQCSDDELRRIAALAGKAEGRG